MIRMDKDEIKMYETESKKRHEKAKNLSNS